MSEVAFRQLMREFGPAASRALGSPLRGGGRYHGVPIHIDDSLPDDELRVTGVKGAQVSAIHVDEIELYRDAAEEVKREIIRAAEADMQSALIPSGGIVTVKDDGEWKEIGRVRTDRYSAVLSDLWKAVEENAAGPEERLYVAEVGVPAWVIIRGGANADEINARLVLEHQIKPTTGGDRYHELHLHLETGRGTLTEQVHWSSGMKAPQPSDWHRALTDIGLIGE